MPLKHSLLVVLLSLSVGLYHASSTFPSPLPGPEVYVEPNLWSATTETLPVIVTAGDSPTAAAAVEQVGGQVTSDLWLIDAVAATLPSHRLAALTAASGVHSIVSNKPVESASDPLWDGWVTPYRYPVPWDGSPDAQPLADALWQLANPVMLDVGADITHQSGVTGDGVTVAVVDSGVYFPPLIRLIFGWHLNQKFLGQADFVGQGTCSNLQSRVQYPGYCFSTNKSSTYDGYGHGSHIAGIIWNNIYDIQTGERVGIAPDADILSVRVLDANGSGAYADVIEGIQYVVANKDTHNVRVMNLSLSAHVTTPYFMDPINRAVEAAWANGIVVVAAAGNLGSKAETITVPGNDPYVITVGAVSSPRTPGYWGDDSLAGWSSTGPTWDGFAKPDVLAPGTYVTSFMYRNESNNSLSDKLVQQHPDNAVATTLFRMSGTSQATAVASGVVALMLEETPNLTPDQVKYRLMISSRPALANEQPVDLVYNVLQQGMGRIWAPEAVFGDFPAGGAANQGMDINADLTHGLGWVDANGNGLVDTNELDPNEMAYHYRGNIGRQVSDDGRAYLYYLLTEANSTQTNSPAEGQTYKVYAEQDSWILQGNPAENHGSDVELLVQNKAGDARRALFRFGLPSIAANERVVSAKAYFYVTQANNNPVKVHRLTKSWTEVGITWSGIASNYDTTADGTFTPAAVGQYVAVDMTTLVQEWINGVAPNYGLTLIGVANDQESKYAGNGYGGINQKPYLEILTAPIFDPGRSGRVTNGLVALYDFEESSGNTVYDVSGIGSPLNLTIGNPAVATWVAGGLSINSSTIVKSAGPATKII
ncbi:MAG TPA: S8 family serine peptidase, partial [Anaerolineae bacterium]|nr:S8 family serine peptidase [Anaerolineae bacterium]